MSDELKTTVEQRTLVFQTQVKRWINVECPACQGKGCEACYQTGKVSVLGYKTYLEVIGEDKEE